jgi:WD40 repeat protein
VLPYRDVIRAVRDRYTQASGNNLLASDNAEHTIRNWLPWADWVDQRNQPLAPRLDFQPATAASAPAVTLSAVGDSPQVLSIDPTVGGTNFLELDIGAEPFAVSRPTLILAAPERGDGPTSGRSRAVNSGAPLVFSPQCVASLASLGPSADNPTPLVLVGRADGTVVLTSWNKLVNQFEVAARFPAGARAVTGVALDASNNTLSIAASNKDKSARLWTMPAPGGLLVLSRFRGSIVPASTTTTFPHPDEVTCIALDGPWLLTGCADGQARLWKVDQPAAPVKIIAPAAVPGPPPAVTAVGMALQGTTSTLLVADASGELRRFDRNDASSTPSPLQMIPDPLGRSLPLRLLAIDKSSGKVATGVGDTQLFFWSPRSATDGTLSLTTTDSGFPASLASVYGPDAGLAVAHGVEPGETPILVGGTDAIARVHAVGAPGIDRVVLDCRGSEVSAVVALSDGLGGGWLVAGTTAGTLQAWSLADDSEVANPFPDAAQTGAIYDNLGVVRSALPVNPGGPWVVEQLLGPDGAALISVTYAAADTSAAPLFLVEPDSAGSPRYRTELRLACAALKLAGGAKGDVVVPPHGSNFEVAPFTLGAYSLWSAAENDPTSRFGQARYWPRLGGAPVFPTRLKQLVLDPIGGAAGWQAAALTYEAALINPLELTADGPSDRVLPSVRDAVARGSVVTVSLTSTANVAAVTLADGANALFDWAFDVDDQPDPQAGAFPGKLARLAGTVAVTQGRVVLTVDPARSAALVFGRLWPLALAAPLTLVTEAIVSNGQAVGVAYRAAGAPAGVALDIVQDEAAGPSLSFSLPVALPPAIGTGYLLGATVATQIDQDGTTVAALALTLRNNKDWPAGVVQPLNAALTEGGVFGFVLDPAVAPVAGATPLNGVLVLWNEGDPASPTLGGVLVSEELRPKVPAQLDPAGWKLVGDRLEMTIVASVVDPAGAIQWYQRQVWSWALGPDPATPPPVALNLLINEQTAKGAQSFVTAYVDVSTGATPMPRIQGPVRLMLKADDGSLLKWNAGLAHARAVAPPVVAPDRLTDLEFPMASGTVRAFTLAEAVEQTSLSSSDPVAAFVQLVIDAAGVSLFKVLEDQVPLDLCLEPDAVAPPTLLPPSVPQLVHRAVFGGQLRVALWPPDQALDPPQSNLPFDPGTHSWLLSPVGPADRGCVLNSQRLWLSETATGDDLRTEDVLVLFREVAGPDATAAREVRAAGGPRPLPSVVSVLSGTAVNTDDPLFPAERVRAAVLQAGATGMVVRRTLQLGGLARYDFEPSPFVGSSQAATAVFLTSTPGRLVASPPATPPTIDQRLIAPEVVRSWTIADAPAYALRSMSFDPYREDACAPARALEFSRRGPAVPSLSKPTGSGAPALACRVAEVPAFQEAAPLWYVPRELPPTPTGRNQFLPCNVRLRFGPDKPGAMVQHLITPLAAQPMKGDPPRWTLGPTTELALREPQRIKVSDCVTAGVTVLDATLTAGAFPDDLRRLSVHWNELIGRVTFDARPLPATTSQLLLRAGSAYRFSSTPFLAVVQFDQTVFALRPDDKTLPIYQLEAGGNTVRRAPRIFLITRLPNLGNPIDFDDGTGPLHFQPYVVVKSSQPLKPDGNALLGELFQQVAVGGGGSDGLIVWEYSPTADAAKRPESPDADVFQFVWMATDSKGAVWSAPYASGPVVLNPLGASPLLPKLAAVVSQFPPPAGSPPLARTAFFGDAAPPDQAAPRFEKVAPLYNFVLEVSDLRETVQFTRRPGDGSATFRLDLIKYLVPGQVVSGSSSVKSPTRLILRNVYEHRGDR